MATFEFQRMATIWVLVTIAYLKFDSLVAETVIGFVSDVTYMI